MSRLLLCFHAGLPLALNACLMSTAIAACANPSSCTPSCGSSCQYDTCVTQDTPITQLPVTIYPTGTVAGAEPCTGLNRTIKTLPFVDDGGDKNTRLPSQDGIAYTWCKTQTVNAPACAPVCGNGVIESGEGCDPPSGSPCPGCSYCSSSCQPITCACPSCSLTTAETCISSDWIDGNDTAIKTDFLHDGCPVYVKNTWCGYNTLEAANCPYTNACSVGFYGDVYTSPACVDQNIKDNCGNACLCNAVSHVTRVYRHRKPKDASCSWSGEPFEAVPNDATGWYYC